MQIEIHVTGGTDRTTRFDLYLNGQQTGELQVQRSDFSKLCDLLFKGEYMISEATVRKEE